MDRVDTFGTDLVLTDPLVIDLPSFELWCAGWTASDAARHTSTTAGNDAQESLLLRRDIEDQYRMFAVLEPNLMNPRSLYSQPLFQLTVSDLSAIVEKYYSLDDVVVREFLGKKLSQKERKDLDSVSERVHISLASCRRQFDNLRRVYRYLEDSPVPAAIQTRSVVASIQAHFLLPRPLAERYACILFLCHHRFESTKKRLLFLNTADMLYIASVLMEMWAEHTPVPHSSLELSSVFTNELRDLKTLLTADREVLDEYRTLVLQHLVAAGGGGRDAVISQIDAQFTGWMKSLLTLGAALSQASGYRDLFLQMVEKVWFKLKQCGVGPTECQLLFQALLDTFQQVSRIADRHRHRYQKTWARFLHGVQACVLHFYARDTGHLDPV